MNLWIKALLFFWLLLPTKLWAYYTHHDTGEVLKSSQYKLGLGTQFITDPKYYSSTHFNGYLDSGLSEEANVRVALGAGSKFFNVGAFYKWVPYPDYGKQPAIGVRGGVIYARHSDDNVSDSNTEISLRANPFISKMFKTVYGDINAYSALHLGIRGYNDKTTIPAQLSFGGEIKTNFYNATMFTGEIGVNMAKAFTYISVGIVFFVDDNKDYKLENPLKLKGDDK